MNASFKSSQTLPQLSGPNEELQLDYAGPANEELQLDYAGPLSDCAGNVYILVAIDGYSKYPSAMITRSTGGKKT